MPWTSITESDLTAFVEVFRVLTVTNLSKPAAARSGQRRQGLPVDVNSATIPILAANLNEIIDSPCFGEGERVARVMIAITEAEVLVSANRQHRHRVRRHNAELAVLLASVLTKRTDGAGILNQCAETVLVTYLCDPDLEPDARRASLAKVCQYALARVDRAGTGDGAVSRDRPLVDPGLAPIGNIGTPITRVTAYEQQLSLNRAEAVEAEVLNFGYRPDVPGRDIVPAMIGLTPAGQREEEAESTLMHAAFFIGIDGQLCALGMGYAVRSMELWGGAVLVFGQYPSGDGLARAYPGSMNGREAAPTSDDAGYLRERVAKFLREKEAVILTRYDQLVAAAERPLGPLNALHQRIAETSPFLFDATALTHRRALFLTEDPVHYLHITDTELDVLIDLGLAPVSRRPVTDESSETRAASEPTACTPDGDRTVSRAELDGKSFQNLRGFAQANGLSVDDEVTLIRTFYEPDVAVSNFSGSLSYHDWLRLAEHLGMDVA